MCIPIPKVCSRHHMNRPRPCIYCIVLCVVHDDLYTTCVHALLLCFSVLLRFSYAFISLSLSLSFQLNQVYIIWFLKSNNSPQNNYESHAYHSVCWIRYLRIALLTHIPHTHTNKHIYYTLNELALAIALLFAIIIYLFFCDIFHFIVCVTFMLMFSTIHYML